MEGLEGGGKWKIGEDGRMKRWKMEEDENENEK
jgi:hypothetical protein